MIFRPLSLVLLLLVAFLPIYFAATQPAQQTRTPIKHVIIILKENRSFDNLFGTYPYGHGDALRAIP